jgi:hypothetical protein
MCTNQIQNNYLWRNVNPDIVKTFLSQFKVSESLVRVDPANLLQFINVQISNGELTHWNIALMSKTNTDNRYPY